MPAVGAFSGTPASIKASDEPQTVAIDEEPFELGDLGDHPYRVGKFGGRRQHRMDGAPGKFAMADLAPPGRTHAASFADRIGGEIIMQQEALLISALQPIDILLVFAGPERGDDEGLSFAAGEQGRTMGARQNAHLREDRSHRLHVAPIDTDARVENVPAHDLGLEIVEGLGDEIFRETCLAFGRRKRCEDSGLDRVDRIVAVLFRGDLIGFAKLRLGKLAHRRLDRALVVGDEIARFLGRLFGEPDNRLDHRLEALMAGHDRL